MVLAAREVLPPDLAEQIRERAIACSSVPYFLGLCFAHQCAPSVARSLSQVDAAANPTFLLGSRFKLRDYHEKAWMPRRQAIAEAMEIVAQVLNRSGIPFAFIKGLQFAKQFYSYPEVRACNDVDFIVTPSHHEDAGKALEDAGFYHEYGGIVAQAKANYESKVEMCHVATGIRVEYSWYLSGNAGIGKVYSDMQALWQRAARLGQSQYQLSAEDSLLNLVRHFGHGHDFGNGLIHACLDASSLLRRCEGRLDWDYIARQATCAEYLRGLEFFGDFYDCHYRDATMPEMMKHLRPSHRRTRSLESRAFSRVVLQSSLTLPLSRTPELLLELISGNLLIMAKFWALDRTSRLLKILRAVVWPEDDEVILLRTQMKGDSLEIKRESLVLRRIHLYASLIIPGAPGILLGTCLFLLSRLNRAVSPRAGSQP